MRPKIGAGDLFLQPSNGWPSGRKEAITGLWADFFWGDDEKAWALIVKACVFIVMQKSLRARTAGRSYKGAFCPIAYGKITVFCDGRVKRRKKNKFCREIFKKIKKVA